MLIQNAIGQTEHWLMRCLRRSARFLLQDCAHDWLKGYFVTQIGVGIKCDHIACFALHPRVKTPVVRWVRIEPNQDQAI